MRKTEKVRIDVEVTKTVRNILQAEADKNKRALRRQVEWILERYAAAKQEDGA